MIAELTPYPAYKDSGVPWLGTVPEHWQVRRLKAVAAQINEQTSQKTLEEVYVALEHVESWTGRVRLPIGSVSFDSQVKRFRRGDVLFGKLRPYLAKVARLPVNGVCVGEFLVLRPTSGFTEAEFLEIILRSRPIIDVINSSTFGAKMPRADWDIIGNLPLACPSLPEQSAIVRFLDHIDRRIRHYVSSKQKLIKLLEEQKQAIIHRAVIRGLDPNVRLKPSGVEWLGDVPEHWEIRPVKYFYREVDDRSKTGQEELLSVSHITGVTPRSQKNITMFMASSYVGHKLCRPGDLAINTMWAWMAALGIVRQKGIVSPSYSLYRPCRASALLGDYAELLLRTTPYINEYVRRSTGIQSSRLRLYPEQFLRIWLVCPPMKEQIAILKRVKVEIAETERAIEATQREISLLREYRTRLIADVVTGKVDVREAAERLPNEAEETELIDDTATLAEGGEDGEDQVIDPPPEEDANG